MDGWQIALLVSAVLFAAFLGFRMRPLVSAEARNSATSLKEARRRILEAKDDDARVLALCDAGHACATLNRNGAAVSFYLRALGVRPMSKIVLERAIASLAHRPGTLEKLLWRALGAAQWPGASDADAREGARVALRALVTVYERRVRTQPRARAIGHVLALLESDAQRSQP